MIVSAFPVLEVPAAALLPLAVLVLDLEVEVCDLFNKLNITTANKTTSNTTPPIKNGLGILPFSLANGFKLPFPV